MIYLFYIFIFLVGLIFGSFIAAWTSRAHREISIWSGRSKCVSCDSILKARDLIPLISFLVLKGKCRNCSTKISRHYFLTEFCFAFLLTFLAWIHHANFFSFSFDFIFQSIVLFFFMAIFVSDFLYQEIPFSMTLVPTFLLFIISLVWGNGDYSSMIFGVIIAGGFFLFQYLISSGKWIGFGDVGLGTLIGVILGWEKTLLALFLAYVCGGLISVILLRLKKITREMTLPFGVFLTTAGFIALLFGDKIIDWYFNFL